MSRSQSGFTLLELILVIGLLSMISLLSFYEKQTDLEQSRARQIGGYLYQYNNAVRSALAQGLITSTTTKLGTDWLKNSTCGGVLAVGSEFLPCDFPSATTSDPISFGRLGLSTAVVVTGSGLTKKYTATTTTSPFILVSTSGVSKVRADLAGIASLSAAAALTSGYQVGASNGLTPYTATTDSSYKSDPISGKITIIASNTASNDVWLRTDGGNKMHATLNFDGTDPSDRMIVGASSLQNFAGQVLRIGNGSGLSPVTGAGVVIDSAAEVLGEFRVRRSLTVDIDLTVTGDISASGNVISKKDVKATGSVTGQVFYDSNDIAYYVDPDSTSNLKELNAITIISSGRMKAGEFLELGGVATEGVACNPNGLTGRNAAGLTLSCQSGVWASLGTSGEYSYFAKATCPAGWVAANGLNGTIDLRGEFIRSLDSGRGVDTGRVLGSAQTDMLGTHSHTGKTTTDGSHSHGYTSSHVSGGGSIQVGDGYTNTFVRSGTESSGAHSHTLLINSTGGLETRPRNKALLACMKL